MRIPRKCQLLAMTTATAALAAGAAVSGAVGAPPRDPVGAVFMVNPVQSSTEQDQGQSLTDQKDSASAVPDSAYARVPLQNLDGSGFLRGRWVAVESSTGKAAYSSAGQYIYNRNQDQFEQVMAYFWIDRAQEYLQSLGFGTTPGLPGVMDEQIAVKINQYGGDNSYQTDKPFRLRFGKGGVDDAEDAEVIVHEYGHAIHADQKPGFGTSLDARAIGEGFSDYFAVSVGLHVASSQVPAWPVRGETDGEIARTWEAEACVADWDATSYYGGTVASCLRRLDQDDRTVATRTGDIHTDGMIWSGALWRIRQAYPSIQQWDRTLIEAQFDFDPDTSFADAALATVAEAQDNEGDAAAAVVRAEFVERGILN